MEFDINKENVSINKLICEKKELVFVEEDMIVPDSKPDILNAINVSGNVCIYKKEIMDGKIKIDGCVNTYIMYLPDSGEDNLRGLNATIDFSQTVLIAECKEGMDANIKFNIKDLECKVINGRKINVRAGLDIKIKIYSNDEIEIITGLNNMDDIQLLNETLITNSLIGKSSTRVYVKDTLNVDTEDEVAEILKAQISLTDNDIKISYNKVLSKCEVDVKIMYLTETGKINSVQGKIPAVGFIDMQNISEDNICDIRNEINNIIIRPNAPEDHSIYVEVEIETTCIAYEKREISVIQDLYSPAVEIGFSQKRINVVTNKMVENKQFTITSKTNISELSDGKLLDTDAIVIVNKEQITKSKIIYEGEISINFIFMNSAGNVSSKISKIPFEVSINNPIQNENIAVETNINIINKNFEERTNGDIDCSFDLECEAEISQDTNINVIENIEMQEEDKDSGDYDSLIIYIVQNGDTLWKIAKRFRSTIDDIARVNGIEDVDKLEVGQKLYIPKFKYTSKVVI